MDFQSNENLFNYQNLFLTIKIVYCSRTKTKRLIFSGDRQDLFSDTVLPAALMILSLGALMTVIHKIFLPDC